MADVQPDRAMPVHRDMLPALCLADLTPSELKVALAVLRASWGWSTATTTHRLSHAMLERLTGIRDRKQRKRALEGLESKGVIALVAEADPAASRPAEWAIQKDYDVWPGVAAVPWRQAPGDPDPPGCHTPGVQPPGAPRGVEPPSPRGSGTPLPPGVQNPPHEAQVEAQVEAQPEAQDPVLFVQDVPAQDPVIDVWASWREQNPTARKAPTKGQRAAIKSRLKDHTAEDLAIYYRWVRQSPHKRAAFVRDEGHDGWESVMRRGHVDERMPWAKAWAAGAHQGKGWRQSADAYAVPGYEHMTPEELLAEGDALGWNGANRGQR